MIADPTDVFRARCEVGLYFHAVGAVELAEALDHFQDAAEQLGAGTAYLANDYYGLTDSFARACRLAEAEHGPVPDPLPIARPKYVPTSTLDAAEYLLQQGDPKRFEAWLLEHSERERAAIVAHLDNKGCKT